MSKSNAATLFRDANGNTTHDKTTDEMLGEMGAGNHPFTVGACYFFRAVPFHLTGRVKAIQGDWLVLEDAAWIADSGRFSDCILGKSEPAEVEPVGSAYLQIGHISDAFPWPHALPRKQK